MDFVSVKKILVFKLCCLGDIVFITPSINALKKNFPEAEIDIIVSGWVKNIVEFVPEINKTLIFLLYIGLFITIWYYYALISRYKPFRF